MSRHAAPAVDVRPLYEAAIGRLKRDRSNDVRSYTREEEREARMDGRTLPRHDWNAPDYRDARTAAEFFDDRIITHGSPLGGGSMPAAPVLVAVADAARESAAAAVEALAAARQLEPQVQFNVYRNLLLWKSAADAGTTGAAVTVSALLREYSRLRLPEEDPSAPKPEKRQIGAGLGRRGVRFTDEQ